MGMVEYWKVHVGGMWLAAVPDTNNNDDCRKFEWEWVSDETKATRLYSPAAVSKAIGVANDKQESEQKSESVRINPKHGEFRSYPEGDLLQPELEHCQAKAISSKEPSELLNTLVTNGRTIFVKNPKGEMVAVGDEPSDGGVLIPSCRVCGAPYVNYGVVSGDILRCGKCGINQCGGPRNDDRRRREDNGGEAVATRGTRGIGWSTRRDC